jgi:hypothetical protein
MHKTLVRLIQGAAIILLSTLGNLALAADLTGTWAVNVTTAAGPGELTIELKQEGNALSGSYSGVLGTAPLTGSVDGDSFTWSYTIEGLGEITYSGSVQDDGSIKGEADYGQMLGKGPFSGKRK